MSKDSKEKIIKKERKHTFYLVVKSEFLHYQRGDTIHEESEIDSILVSPYLQSILKVSYPSNE